jgi:precorrin-2 dehydrogenase / sirohydrochlorin ferrochelatase
VIVHLNLQDRLVIVVGGGSEALKRINSLLKENCQILVLSNKISRQIKKLVKDKKIKFKKQEIQDATILASYKPYMIITTTNDNELNQNIINNAKKNKIIVYSSDNPESSDFANLAIIDFENTIQIAVFTGGKSPAMSKKLRIQSEKIFKKIITREDINQIRIQKIARELAKNTISSQKQRKIFLYSIMNDNEIKQLIKDDKLKRAEKRVAAVLRNWK